MKTTPILHRHPEQREDEIFLGNAIHEEVRRSSWKTSRFGNVAYMVDGTELPRPKDESYMPLGYERSRPWFIKKSEVEGEIKFKTFMQGSGWQSEVAVLQRLLDEAKGGVKLPSRLFNNPNVRFVFVDEGDKVIKDDETLIWDATATDYPSEKETYSFRPADSGCYTFWTNSYEIVKIES